MPTYDVVVAGLGGFGSSAAAHLARRGLRVLGLDPRPGAHDEGSSHGGSRIVRQVYFEGAAYVPLLRRTYELWDELHDAGRRAACCCARAGCSSARPAPASSTAASRPRGTGASPTRCSTRRRSPRGSPRCARRRARTRSTSRAPAWCRRRRRSLRTCGRRRPAGAELRHDEAVTGWVATDGPACASRRPRGTIDAGALVLAPGQVGAGTDAGLEVPLVVEERVQHWYAPGRPADFAPGRFPVWVWETPDGTSMYGAPALGRTAR